MVQIFPDKIDVRRYTYRMSPSKSMWLLSGLDFLILISSNIGKYSHLNPNEANVIDLAKTLCMYLYIDINSSKSLKKTIISIQNICSTGKEWRDRKIKCIFLHRSSIFKISMSRPFIFKDNMYLHSSQVERNGVNQKHFILSYICACAPKIFSLSLTI